MVRWRRAQIVLWSAQAMDVPAIARIAFTSEDRVREVIHNFNADGFDSLAPKYAGGRPPKFTLPERQQIKKVALSRPVDHGLPFSTWSLSKLAEFVVAEGVVDDISHEGLRVLLRKEGVSFQVIEFVKQSNDPDFEAKKNRIPEFYAIADGKALPGKDDPRSATATTEASTNPRGRSAYCSTSSAHRAMSASVRCSTAGTPLATSARKADSACGPSLASIAHETSVSTDDGRTISRTGIEASNATAEA